MTADDRITAARELLAAMTPYPALGREAAELRRVLAQLMTYVDDTEFEEQLHDVTGLTVSGGARLSPEDVLVLAEALSDAISYRAPDTCRDCASGLPCEDAEEDIRRRHAYQALAGALGCEGDS